jgi:hypothetical protein
MTRFAISAAVLLVGSCSPPTYTILARMDGSNILLEAKDRSNWFTAPTDARSLVVTDREGSGWSIHLADGCAAPKSPFPITYGKLPACFIENAPPAPLKRGPLYHVHGIGQKQGDGYFRLTAGSVTNYGWGQVRGELASWEPDSPMPLNGFVWNKAGAE